MSVRCQAFPDPARPAAGAQARAMTLHLPQTTQTARPAALRTRPATDASGSEWPHGNRMTAALLLAEDQTLAMAPPCTAASCIPTVTAAVTQDDRGARGLNYSL